MRAGGINLFGDPEEYEYTAYEAVHEMYERCVLESSGGCDEAHAKSAALIKGLSKALSDLERLDEIEKKIMDLLCK